MAQQTDIHGWDIPVPDEDEEWGIILNDFFDGELDREVILFGQSHERPPAGSGAPHLFFDVDAERIDFNDGTQWIDGVVGSHDPEAHASTHESGGSDEITHNDLALSSDDHHAKYTNADAVAAIEAANALEFGRETPISGGYASFIVGDTMPDPFLYDYSHNMLWWGDQRWTFTVSDSTGVSNPGNLFMPGDNWVSLDMSSTADPLTFTLEGFTAQTTNNSAFRGLFQAHRDADYDDTEIELKGDDDAWYTLDSWTNGNAGDTEPAITERTGNVTGLDNNHPYHGIRLTLSNKTTSSGDNYLECLALINGKLTPAWSGIYLTRGDMGESDPQQMFSDLDMGDSDIVAPGGEISEQGDRVATRVWANPEIAVEDGGTSVLSAPVTLDFGNNLDVTDDGSSGVTVDASGGGTFSGSHDDLTDVDSDDHHTKTSSASELSDVSADSVSDAHHAKTQPSDIDSTNWGDYEIQKDGTDGAGIINFKTS